ncbi:hypothetical protein EKE94_00890 [Mesobaculum littorinae]|uniref:Activator of Hsp90 ATPase homologue 1/2-like C-terminal domain-containing protein n=1 Tax=Mesobaculum littorinae TaxID=2486419 RepID=A0A438AL06_9RHOB|nr:SRPBCC domain-containing protein [Mesobaculum littorinae]RVV99286.1 hypothetical protein EKE94_00890 [Mesobaculum littorinae]
MTPPIRKSLAVPLTPDAAFRLFAERTSTWWPAPTTARAANDTTPPLGSASALDFEPRQGGTVRCAGRPCGQVTAWTPGKHLAFDWHQDGAPVTRVDIRFVEEAAGCLVVLTHDGFDEAGRPYASAA